MRILLPALLLILAGSCADPREKIPFPAKYTWRDSVLGYRLSNHDLVLIFPHTENGRWWADCDIYNKNNGRFLGVLQKEMLQIKAHETRILFANEDSLPIDSIGFHFSGLPEGGKLLKGHSDAFYETPQLVSFEEKSDHKLHYVYSKFQPIDGWYALPDSLLYGKDSAYFREKAKAIYYDSLGNHRHTKAEYPGGPVHIQQ